MHAPLKSAGQSVVRKGTWYWQDVSELQRGFAGEADEFASPIESKGAWDATTRRDFIKWMGFGVGAAALAACETPVRHAIPYLNKPMDVTPGVATYYASTYDCNGHYGSLLVKTREGRPIKLAPNPDGVLSAGTSPQIEASVLDLYDEARIKGPHKQGQSISWDALDAAVQAQLAAISDRGRRIALVSHSVISPSTRRTIALLQARYPSLEHIVYDTPSYAGLLDANMADFGIRALPEYDLTKADCMVSIGADFLGSWGHAHLFAHQFAKGRQIGRNKKNMSQLYVLEAGLSLTGTQADHRYPIRPSQYTHYLAQLYHALTKNSPLPNIQPPAVPQPELVTKLVQALKNAQGRALVLCGTNDLLAQRLCNAINHVLGAYERKGPLSWDRPWLLKQGDDRAMQSFVKDLISDTRKKDIEGVLFYNCNPVYDHPQGQAIASALKGRALTLSTAGRMDETAQCVEYVAPDHHYLEAWNDHEPARGLYGFSQPSISPLFATRQAQASFLQWAEHPTTDYLTFLKAEWQARQTSTVPFQTFWDRCLYKGSYAAEIVESEVPTYRSEGLSALMAQISTPKPDFNWELVLYESAIIGSGAQANNPWLQELPDPISKVSWDNYVAMAPADAERSGLAMKDDETRILHIQLGAKVIALPVLIQPGQAQGTLSIALGYGRTAVGPVGNGVGYNAFADVPISAEGYRQYDKGIAVEIAKVAETYTLARMQTHSTTMHRASIIQEASLAEYQQDPSAGRHRPKISTAKGKVAPQDLTLWDAHSYPNHHWGMVIDLNTCTGCNACVVACQAENNIPVVGKKEVMRKRDMHWLRIDRYYKSAGTPGDRSLAGLAEAERPADNPEVVFQPMLCQHCNNAPCETVCPVAATTHSSEGLNQMTYNRCVGTRYCANNCPYKVRRFNWFKYHDNDQFPSNTAMNNALGKMALNPDVTVRARGVMEKCSFCVQRIQAGKLKAKQAQRPLQEGDVEVACASACPTNAITFGDMKDKKSRISRKLALKTNKKGMVKAHEARAYHVLEELNVRPNVWYLTKIRNQTPS